MSRGLIIFLLLLLAVVVVDMVDFAGSASTRYGVDEEQQQQQQRVALEHLYQTTGGPTMWFARCRCPQGKICWGARNSSYCQWYGILCGQQNQGT